MKNINLDKRFGKNKNAERPDYDEVVFGWDERKKKWVKVKYREDSNVFFDIPYTGQFYLRDQMFIWKHINN